MSICLTRRTQRQRFSAILFLLASLITPSIASADLDLFVGRVQGDTLGVQNLGDGSGPVWTRTESWDLPEGTPFSIPAVADLDDDGDKDAIIGFQTGNTRAYQNTGTDTVPRWELRDDWKVADVGVNASPEFADIDGDGDFDLLVGNSAGLIRFYENTGSPAAPVWTRNEAWDLNTDTSSPYREYATWTTTAVWTY